MPVAVLRDLDARAAGRAARPGLLRGRLRRLRRLRSTSWPRARPRLERLRRLDAAHRRGRRGLERRGQGAGLEPQPAGRRRRARREQGLRRGATPTWCGASCTASSRATAGCATTRPSTSRVVARAFGWTRGRGARRARQGAPREPAGEPRLLRRHHRLRRLLRRHLPVVGARLRQRDQEPGRPGALRRHDATSRRSPSEGLFADQKIAIAPIRTASQGALEGDPLLSKDIRFFFEPNSVDPRQERAAEPGVPRHDQALPAGEPRLDGAAARPRRQRAGRRVPPAGRRAAGEEHGAQGHGAVAPARPRGAATRCCERYPELDASRASRRSGAAGRSRPAPTATRTAASRCSGSRWSEGGTSEEASAHARLTGKLGVSSGDRRSARPPA